MLGITPPVIRPVLEVKASLNGVFAVICSAPEVQASLNGESAVKCLVPEV
jgi:hypothetical protein